MTEKAALRYTPAGLPALDLLLSHESVVLEDGIPRKVSMELRGLCIGEVSRVASKLGIGADCKCSGFLTPGRNGRGLVFHITGIE